MPASVFLKSLSKKQQLLRPFFHVRRFGPSKYLDLCPLGVGDLHEPHFPLLGQKIFKPSHMRGDFLDGAGGAGVNAVLDFDVAVFFEIDAKPIRNRAFACRHHRNVEHDQKPGHSELAIPTRGHSFSGNSTAPLFSP